MTGNRLALETSPYLLQHQDNPVHWWAWGPEALAEAKRTGKPILLSVGYAACHWCHVMAHESFEDEATARVMNELYINIKVDREERPDIDAIYMGALHRLGEQGGWPLTMFLDSDARPFWGGTYFPKQSKFGRPAFVTVLMRIAEAFHNQPEKVANNAARLIASLTRDDESGGDGGEHIAPIAETSISELAQRIARAVDPEHGGLSGAPKFPQWNVFWLLWRAAMRFENEACKSAVITTLDNICQGGIYDHLGGGFARYSVDEFWLVPHFEKMLYDNALLIDLLTEVYRETQSPLYAVRVRETVEWLKREMIAEGGGFAASLDADSEGEEGKFYVWTADEIGGVLGADDAAFFNSVYGVTADGNFEGHTILNRLSAMEMRDADDERRLENLRRKLLERRASRIRPGWDDKDLADWNGLMIAALARASLIFDEPDWLEMAKRAFAFVTDKMVPGEEKRLVHSFRKGRGTAPATASDYANMIWAALRLFEATGETDYLQAAIAWTDVLDRRYWVAPGGYATAADDTSDVIVRLKTASDDAVPSANAIQLSNLIQLGALTGDDRYDKRARQLIGAFAADAANGPVGHCGFLAAQLDLDALVQVAITGGEAAKLQMQLWQTSVPGSICSSGKMNNVQFVAARAASLETGGALVCVGQTCGLPANDPAEFKRRLLIARTGGLA